MKPRILLLYEYSPVGLPHSSAYIRLLLPLSRPSVQERFYVTPAPVYCNQDVEMVIVDRLWRPDISMAWAERLVAGVRAQGAKLIYHIDDDLLHAPAPPPEPTVVDRPSIVRLFLQAADGVIVSTPALADRLAPYNDSIHVIGNALDERLVATTTLHTRVTPFTPRPVVIGYMGTYTHDDDLRMVLPALSGLADAVSTPVRLELIGGAARAETLSTLQSLPFPVRIVHPPAVEYPRFMLWFTGSVSWDIAIAPLADTLFNRCKSDIKFLDYSALGATGIYSRVPAYARTVEHRKTGWLAMNETEAWREALRTLIEQAELRRELASHARRHLFARRTLSRRIDDWTAVLDRIWHG